MILLPVMPAAIAVAEPAPGRGEVVEPAATAQASAERSPGERPPEEVARIVQRLSSMVVVVVVVEVLVMIVIVVVRGRRLSEVGCRCRRMTVDLKPILSFLPTIDVGHRRISMIQTRARAHHVPRGIIHTLEFAQQLRQFHPLLGAKVVGVRPV